MLDLFALLFLLSVAGLIALTAVLLVSPLLVWSWAAAASPARKAVGVAVAYVAISAALGACAYEIVPAQYTRDLGWRWPPTSSALGEIHGVYLERLGNPEAISPENAPAIRASIERERTEFARRWVTLSAAAGGVLAVGWSVRRFARTGPRV